MIRDKQILGIAPDTSPQLKLESSMDTSLHGSVLVLIQFDVCEEIRLDRLRDIFGARPPGSEFQASGSRIRSLPASSGGRAGRTTDPRKRRTP